MATFHGKGGGINWGGTGTESVEILSWTLEATADVADVTVMGDSWKDYVAGFKDWSGTIEIVADDAFGDLAMFTGQTAATLTLEMVDTANNLEGSAFISGISWTTDPTDAGKATYTFIGNGALAYGAS